MPTYARRALAGLVAGAATAGVLVVSQGPGGAGTSAAAAGKTRAGATGPSRSVTLITGDVVRIGSDGKPEVMAGGTAVPHATTTRRVPHARYQRDGDWYVLPTDAVPLVRAGLLDDRLFNVTGLVRQGLDDADTDRVPLLVQYADAATAQKAKPLAGAKARRALPKLKLTANDQPKAGAARFWTDLVRGANPKAHTIAGGVRKVWLNARYQASLEQSVPQVGAPSAWQAGYSGKDVTVAVLDSGYDTDHPDLAGRVATAKNFTETDSVEDRAGHGTHVASIVAGSGAASAGKRRGVAPDARLAIGKVLDDRGVGYEDSILAGMQWAVTEAGAKVVNMSLGGAVSDGTDPLDQAVNQLSADHGALFVVAAGNRGAYAPVSSPASADAALAVSSVDRLDKISPFSSRGPRYGDGAAKPELAAPGDAIMAARATGTNPEIAGDPDYVPLSGTSMAAPHVAGAAAILAQQHPDWSGTQLKAALVASAAPAKESRVFDVGAGRLDVARAVTQQTQAAPASLSAHLPWAARDETRELSVTYTNDSDAPVSLQLALNLTDTTGKPAPDGVATLGASTVTVPAHGKAPISVRVAGQGKASGSYGGVLVATGGGISLRTPVAVRQDPETHDLGVQTLDRNGAAIEAVSMVIGLDAGITEVAFGSEPIQVPAGRYTVISVVNTPRPEQQPLTSFVANPQVTLAGDATVTLDARWANPVPLMVDDQPSARDGLRTFELGARPVGGPTRYAMAGVVNPRFEEIYVGTTPGVSANEFSFATVASLERPELELSAEAPETFPVRAGWLRQQPEPVPPFEGTAHLTAAHVTVDASGQPAAVDVSDKLAVVTAANEAADRFDIVPVVRALQKRGARMVIMATSRFTWNGEQLKLPTITTAGSPDVDRFVDLARDGGLTATVTGNPVSPFRYVLANEQKGSIPAGLAYRVRTEDLAAVPTSYHNANNEWRLFRPTRLIGDERFSTFWFIPVPSPLRRIEYYNPGNWQVRVEDSAVFDSAIVVLDLRAGSNPPLIWGKAVLGPALTGPSTVIADQPWVSRKGDVVDVALPLFTDAAGHPKLAYDPSGRITGTTSLSRDGQLLGTITQPGWGQFSVPAGAATYRLSAEAKLDSPRWPLSTTISAAWTFRSQTESTRMPLPLLGLSLDAPVDLRNAVEVGEQDPVRVSIHRQTGMADRPISALTVDASYDEGKTWHPVKVTRDDDVWQANVRHNQAGYVSLRASATDADGNTVEQSVIRAYRVGS